MFEKLFESSPDAMLVTTDGGQIARVNRQVEQLFGYTREELLGRAVEVLIPDRYQDVHRVHRGHYRASPRIRPMGAGPEMCARRKDGSEFPVDIMLGPIATEEGLYVLAAIRDVTERKRTEMALRREMAFVWLLQTAADGANEARSVDEAMQCCLDLVCAHTGWEIGHAYVCADDSATELVSTNLWHIDNPEQFERFSRATDTMRFATGVGVPGRVLSTKKPMSIVDVVDDPAFPKSAHFAECGIRSVFAFPVLTGTTVVAVLEFLSTAAVFPEARLLDVVAHIGTQLGRVVERERSRDEQRRLTEQLSQSKKMEALGALAGGVAHDFNNLLTVIAGYSEFVLDGLPPEDRTRADVTEIKHAAERAASLTRQLLAFSRRQVLHPQVLDLNALVVNCEKMLRRLIREDVELIISAGSELGKVKADPGQIEQVIVNLAVNARDAMPRGGTLTIETANAELDETDLVRYVASKPGPYVMLAFCDTGCGMDADTQARIFEPFFTTKEKGQGTGLGLATVYGIVKQSGGYIWVYGEPDHGTTFKIYFPRVEEEAEVVGVTTITARSPQGSETILLIEDDDNVRAFVHRALEGYGYNVLEAAGGDEALAIARQHKEPIHVLLTDLVMPGMSGRELARRIGAVRPQIRILYMTGYAGDAVDRHDALESRETSLQKPFKPEAVARKVREVLDKPLEH